MRAMGVIGLLCTAMAGSAAAQAHTVIVLSHRDHTVNELDPATGKILHTFTAADEPHEGVVAANGRTIYVAVPNGPHVVVLDAATFTPKKTIESEYFLRAPAPAGATGRGAANRSASPHGSALNNDGSKLYVGVENADVSGVIVIDTKTNAVLKKIDLLLLGGHFLAIQPGTNKLYAPMRTDNRVVVLDTKTDRVTAVVPVPGGPVGVGFAPNGEVWIHNDGDGSVAVIDGKTDRVIKTLANLGQGAGRMAVSRDGHWAASTHGTSQDVAIINAQTKEVAATVKTGAGPGFPLFSPDNTKLYVMNSGAGDVCVIDLKQMAVIARYKVGSDPFGGDIRLLGGSR